MADQTQAPPSPTSQFGGTITDSKLAQYRQNKLKYVDESIQMYLDYYVHKKTLAQIQEKFGFKSRMGIYKRLHQLIGELNMLTPTKETA